MPEIDFVMTYPCCFLLGEHDILTTVIIDGNTCLCLFTDSDILKTFYVDKYGPSLADRQFNVVECSGYDGLIGTLRDHQAALAKANTMHLAIDPTPGKLTGYVPIQEFIEELDAN